MNAVLFDLDGTLLDTATDLAFALNAVRQQHSLPDLPIEEIRPHVGYGVKSMLKLAFDIDEQDAKYADLQQSFYQIYQQCLASTTRLFPGMAELLDYLEANAIIWGIVTNKPARFTDPILEAVNLKKRSACVISGDTLALRKPHPAPILHACELIQRLPQDTFYIGDAATDIIASKAAGTHSIAALYGYIGQHEDPYLWQADSYIKEPLEIKALLA